MGLKVFLSHPLREDLFPPRRKAMAQSLYCCAPHTKSRRTLKYEFQEKIAAFIAALSKLDQGSQAGRPLDPGQLDTVKSTWNSIAPESGGVLDQISQLHRLGASEREWLRSIRTRPPILPAASSP